MAKKKRKKGKRPGRPPARPTAPPQAKRRPEEAVDRLEDRAEAREAEERPERARPEGRRADRAAAAAGAAAGTAISNRQARKEQARRERERRMRRARRQRRMRRILRWAIALAVVGGIGFLIWYANTRPVLLEDEQAAAAATALGCGGGNGEIEEPGATGTASHLAEGEAPPDYNSTPATSGPHYNIAGRAPYAGPPVLEEAVAPSSVMEANLVHNLEHAYVIMYYRADGADALPQEAVDALAGIVDEGNKVLLAPYSALKDGTSVAFTAWNKVLPCPQVGDDEVDQLTTVARGFIEQYRGTNNAPEPAGG